MSTTNFVSPFMAWCNASNKEQNALASAMANVLLRINTVSKTVSMSTIVVCISLGLIDASKEELNA